MNIPQTQRKVKKKMIKPSCLVVLLYMVVSLVPPSPFMASAQAGGKLGDISEIISQVLFEEMLEHRNDANCPARGFYTYEAFIAAAKSFNGFGTIGDLPIRQREIAAFLGQTSQETTGPSTAPYTWGYCYNQSDQSSVCCATSQQWPCFPGKTYCGRGPIQLSYNYNYGPAGESAAINYNLLQDPDKVAADPVVSFKSAIWFWMTPQPPKPSCHEVITGQWNPTIHDTAAGRVPGYGLTTNIINGGPECGIPTPPWAEGRIGYYKRYCDLLGVSYGDNLDCASQMPFG